MSRSLKVALEYVKTVKLALKRNSFPRQQDLAEELGISRDTVNRFLNGKAVDYLNFIEICQRLALTWQEVADFGDGQCLDGDRLPEQLISSSSVGVCEPPTSVEKLYNALLRLNYINQVSLFRQFVGIYPVGTCLVHGDIEYGQRWLVNRLVQLVPNGMTAKVIPFGLTRKSRANYINALWRELGGRVGLTGQPKPVEIAEAVCKCWETQNVILIFHNVDRMPKEYLNQFRQDFWLPLSEIASPSPQMSHKLLMFLVDHSGEVEGWDISFAEDLDNWRSHIPLKLPRIERLGDRDLLSWIENSLNELPVEFATDGDRLVKEILENSDNGVPQLVLEYICSLCNCNWYEQERIWLKH